MASALAYWFKSHQDRENLSSDVVCESAGKIFDQQYADQDLPKPCNGYLEPSKKRHSIRSYRRFGESGSVTADFIADNATLGRNPFPD